MKIIYNPIIDCMQAIGPEIPAGFTIEQDMYLEWYYHSMDNKINVGWFEHPKLALNALLQALPFYNKQTKADLRKERKRNNDRIIEGLRAERKRKKKQH